MNKNYHVTFVMPHREHDLWISPISEEELEKIWDHFRFRDEKKIKVYERDAKVNIFIDLNAVTAIVIKEI